MNNTNTTKDAAVAAASFVQIYTIIDGMPLLLKQSNATDTDFWRIFTSSGCRFSNIISRDLWQLAVQLKDVPKMIDMKGQTRIGLLNLLQKLNIFSSDNLPKSRFHEWKYFHKIIEEKVNQYGDEVVFEDVYVSFEGLRFIRDLLNVPESQSDHKTVLEELDRVDYGAPQEEYYYLIQENLLQLLS
jgi:hypothetical protein